MQSSPGTSFDPQSDLDIDDLEERLINTIQEYPHLWRIGSKKYSDRQRAKNSWKEIGDTLNVSAEKAQARWRYLRDEYFRKKREEATTRSGSAAIKRSKWRFYGSLSFLDPILTSRKTSGNLQANGEDSVAEHEEGEIIPDSDAQKKSRKIPASEEQVSTFEESILNVLKDMSANSEEDNFGKVIADGLKQLPPRLKSRTKMKIYQVSL